MIEMQDMQAPEDNTVYIRPVETAELPDVVREQIGGVERIYAVHNSLGQRIALVKDRNTAFILARQNDLMPVNVH